MCTETFSSTLTSEEENAGMGGIAMLTLSDTENNLHFILILQGLIKHKDKGERQETKGRERVSTEVERKMRDFTPPSCWRGDSSDRR